MAKHKAPDPSAGRLLVIHNRQRAKSVNVSRFRRQVRRVLEEELWLMNYEVCLHLVGSPEMTRINETFLQHAGDTDVITFTHPGMPGSAVLYGEIFICVPVAVRQAVTYRTRWQDEVTRYAVHGILHLLGYEDAQPVSRRKMKREENRLMRQLEKPSSGTTKT
ncbi:MAG: rRNA maturation RNase YbeY [Verrucomicrobiota bacterium]